MKRMQGAEELRQYLEGKCEMKTILILAAIVSVVGCCKLDHNYPSINSVMASDGQLAWKVYSFEQAARKCPNGYKVVDTMPGYKGSGTWLIRCK